MSRRREAYSDTFTGEADRNIRMLLYGKDEEGNYSRLRKVILNVINNELTPRQKELIMLYYFKESSMSEISEQTGITIQAVSAVISRARLRIFRILQYYI